MIVEVKIHTYYCTKALKFIQKYMKSAATALSQIAFIAKYQ